MANELKDAKDFGQMIQKWDAFKNAKQSLKNTIAGIKILIADLKADQNYLIKTEKAQQDEVAECETVCNGVQFLKNTEW